MTILCFKLVFYS